MGIKTLRIGYILWMDDFLGRHFLWPDKRRPAIKSLSLTIEQQPFRMPGPHF